MFALSPAARRRTAAVAVLALLMLLAAPASVARAATTLSTPWPAVEVEPGSDVTVTLEVGSSPPQRVDLEVVEAPAGWDTLLRAGGFVVRAVTAHDGEDPTEVDLEVSIPFDAAEGTNRITVAATGQDGSQDQLDVELVVTEEVAGAITLETEFPELSAAADDGFSWNAELRNVLPGETTFALQAAGPPGWIVTARPGSEPQATTVTLEGGDSETINVDAEPPVTVEAGRYDLLVVATGGGQRAELALVAEVEGTVGIALTTADERLNAEGPSGRVTRIGLVVSNTGSTPLEDVRLSADPPAGWEVSFDPDPLPTIAPGDSLDVTALVTPADDAITGDYALGIEVEAEGRADDVEIRFQVRTPLGWGAIGASIIALALAGLGVVFRVYGRR